MKAQSIFYIDYRDNVHPTGCVSVEALTNREIVLKLRQMLNTEDGTSMCSIQAFSENGRFFLVNRHTFVVTFCGAFTPYGDDIKTQQPF